MGKTLLTAFLLPLTSLLAFGQDAFTLENRPQTSSAFCGPTCIPGLAYYWHYADLPQSALVNSWTDRVSLVVVTNVDSAARPSNTVAGVFWGQNTHFTALTNQSSITFPSAQFSIFILMTSSVGVGSVSTLFSDVSAAPGFFLNGSDQMYFRYSGVNHTFANIPDNTAYDFSYLNPGTGSAGGGKAYTNGVATATITDYSTAPSFTEICIGGGPAGGGGFTGKTKVYCIWTNYTFSLTDVANLHTWALSQ